MSAKSITHIEERENIRDNMSEKEIEKEEKTDDGLDMSKLAALKAKSQAKKAEQSMANKIVAKKDKSLNIGVVGLGAAGSKMAEEFYKEGYSAVAINTALQDLKFIDIPESCKLHLEGTLGGASKDRNVGAMAASSNRDAIINLIKNELGQSRITLICSSLGGGSGSGALSEVVDLIRNDIQTPIMALVALPMSSEDVITKSNSLDALVELSKLVKSKVLSNLIVVDNSKLESLLSNINQMDFFSEANKIIVKDFDSFNTYSCYPSSVKALDTSEYAKLLIDSEGLSIFGSISITDYKDEEAIASAIISNLDDNLLAEGFDLGNTKYVGFMIIANEKTLKEIPASSFNYANAILDERAGSPKAIFKGVYASEDVAPGTVKIYSMFTGLSLPQSRIDELKKEVQTKMAQVKNKENNRAINLEIDTGKSETVSAADRIKEKIAAKGSAFGKLMGTVDRRNK